MMDMENEVLSDISRSALENHSNGNNCAQSVLMAQREFTCLDDVIAASISEGFGGGMRCGEMCGAVSGAVMAIGLSLSGKEGIDKLQIAKVTAGFTKAFKKHFGALRCSDLKRKKIDCDTLIAYSADEINKIIDTCLKETEN